MVALMFVAIDVDPYHSRPREARPAGIHAAVT
jgi:hypothetical protein